MEFAAGQSRVMELTLKKAIEYGLQHSGDIGIARANVVRYRGMRLQNQWLPNPDIEIAYEEIPRSEPLSGANDKKFIISQRIPFPTKLITERSMYSKLIDAADKNVAVYQIRTRAGVKSAYYRVLFMKRHIELAGQNLIYSEEFRSKAELSYKVGESSYLEALQGRVEEETARQHLADVKMQYETALSELKLALFLDQDVVLSIEDSLLFESVQIDSSQFFSAGIVDRNPSFQEASLQAEAARLGVSRAKQSYLPDIQASALRQEVGGNPNFFGVSIGLSVPLWFFAGEKGRVEEALASHSEMELLKMKWSLTIRAEITQAFGQVRQQELRVLSYGEGLLLSAREGFRVAEKSYEEGEIGYIEYLATLRTYIRTQSDFYQAVLDYNLSLAELEGAAGISLTEMN